MHWQHLQYSAPNYEAAEPAEYCLALAPGSSSARVPQYYPPAGPYFMPEYETTGEVAYAWTQPIAVPPVDQFSYGESQFMITSTSSLQHTEYGDGRDESQRIETSTKKRHMHPARFPCPFADCNAAYSRRFNLRAHLTKHAEKRPYVCCWTGCGKAFARELDCKRHQKMRCSKAPYLVCHGCCKMFSRSDSLRRHWRNGSGIKCVEKGDALHAAEDVAEMEMLRSPVKIEEDGSLKLALGEVHSFNRPDRYDT